MLIKTDNTAPKKLLIVDDSAEIRKGLKRFVAELSSIELVGEAEDGISALEMIERLKPDFVTLDIRMPGLTGIMTLQEIKKKYPLTTVLMLTNFAFDHYRQICKKEGADYFFDKSHEFEQMIETLKSLSDNSILNKKAN